MGAAWVTRAKSTAILLPNFSFKEIKGAIDPRKISIKLDEEDRNQVVSLLRCLRDELQQEFGLDKVSEEKWADCWQQLLTTDT